MRPTRQRPMHYEASVLHDGTVLAACPMRKPTSRWVKTSGARVEEDGVVTFGGTAGRELGDPDNDRRFRFQDVIANNLNGRRALRELVLPVLGELRKEVAALRAEVMALRTALAGSDGD